MAIAFDAATDGGNNGGTTNSYSFDVTCSGLNRYLALAFLGDIAAGNDDITAVTYDSVSMKLVTLRVSNNRFLYAYGLQNPSSGTHSLTITCTNNHYLIPVAASYTGVTQSAMGALPNHIADNYASSSSDPPALTWTSTLTPIDDNCWVILADSQYNLNNAPLAGSGSTFRICGAAFGEPAIFDSAGVITPPSAYSMETHQDANALAISIDHVIFSIAPATAGMQFNLVRP